MVYPDNGVTGVPSVLVVGSTQVSVAVPLAGGGAETVTVADCAAEPPAPLQVKVNFVVAVSAGVACEPLVDSVPLQPFEAVQDVAFVVDQVSIEVAPLATVVGLALKVTAGAEVVTDTVADCAALPPAPVQVSV
jgi:hypothetical protein